MEQKLLKMLKRVCYLETIKNSINENKIVGLINLDIINKEIEELKEKVESISPSKDRKGYWIVTIGGNRFWPMDPRPEDIHIDDIAHCLSRICRFGGHVKNFMSVAQHSFLVSKILSHEFALEGLLHDASEAYIGDVMTPLKNILGKKYKEIEDNIMDAVIARFGLKSHSSVWEEVKKADLIILATEFRDVARNGIKDGGFIYPPMKERILKSWSPNYSKKRFLERFEDLCPIGVQKNLGLRADSVVVSLPPSSI